MKATRGALPIYILSATLIFIGISASSQAEGSTSSLEKKIATLETRVKKAEATIQKLSSQVEANTSSANGSAAGYQRLSYLTMNRCPDWIQEPGKRMFQIQYSGDLGSGPLWVVWCGASFVAKN
jgi:uncharacterized coiled-coil protein SlyX